MALWLSVFEDSRIPPVLMGTAGSFWLARFLLGEASL